MRTEIETYQEEWKYKWVKSKSLSLGPFEAYDNLSDLLPAEWYEKNALIYIIKEKQLYRARHTKRLKYLGRKKAAKKK